MHVKSESLEYRTRIIIVLVFLALFIGLFIFFLYVHPVVPWDGDDWSAFGGSPYLSKYGLPDYSPGAEQSNRMMSMLLGYLAGYLASFVIYPLTGDYIMSLMAAGALFLAASITLSYVLLYKLFRRYTGKRISLLALAWFFASAFLIYKTKEKCEYLYWNFNNFTIYFYSIPSYLCSALGTYLIIEHVDGRYFNTCVKSGFLVVSFYFCMFSFLPAAVYLAVVCGTIIILTFFKARKVTAKHDRLKYLFRYCWPHMIGIVFFIIDLPLEFKRTFGIGYFHLGGTDGLSAKLSLAASFISSQVTRMHLSFLVPSLAVIFGAFAIYLWKRRKRKLTKDDKSIFMQILLTLGLMLIMEIFYILFGMIDYGHVTRAELFRMDTLYCFYFLMLLMNALCLIIILNNISAVFNIAMLVISIMIMLIVAPKNTYASTYDEISVDHITQYEFMSSIVEQIKINDQNGKYHTIVHMPAGVWHYGGAMPYFMYIHNQIGHPGTIEFIYDNSSDTVTFE